MLNIIFGLIFMLGLGAFAFITFILSNEIDKMRRGKK